MEPISLAAELDRIPKEPTLTDKLRQRPLTNHQKNKLPNVIQKAVANRSWCLVPKDHWELFRYDETALRFEKTSSGVTKVKRFTAGSPTRWLLVSAKTTKPSASATTLVIDQSNPNDTVQVNETLTPAQMKAAAEVYSRQSDGANMPSVCFTEPVNYANIAVAADPAAWRSPIIYNVRQITLKSGESATTIAQKHYGNPDASVVYKLNPQYSSAKPPKAGDTVAIREGAAIEFAVSSRNTSKIIVTVSGAVSKTLTLNPTNAGQDFTETHASVPAVTGEYRLVAEADGVKHTRVFNVSVKPIPTDWLKLTAHYQDPWQTPIPLSNLTVQVNGVVQESKQALNAGIGKAELARSIDDANRTRHDPGALVLDAIPVGDIAIVVEADAGLEQSISDETDNLIRNLDSAYRSLVSDMSEFQDRWDTYGYAAIALDGGIGLLNGGTGWTKDQAELFEAETWKALGSTLSDAAGKTIDVTADYASDVFARIKTTSQDLGEAIDDADLGNWQWWQTQAEDAIEAAKAEAADYASQVKTSVNEALETVDRSQASLQAILTHKEAIFALPEQMARGNVTEVERFVDTVLMEIDPELAQSIKDNPDYYIVLALLENNDAALTYLAYASLIFEAVPPNFYAYTGGKGGAYVAIEVLLLILMSFLTLGTGTAARLTALAAKLAAGSGSVARSAQKLKKAQQALNSFVSALEEIAACGEKLKSIGEKLVLGRNKGVLIKGKSGTTLAAKRETTKRDVRCRYCKSDKHSTPRIKLKGKVVVE